MPRQHEPPANGTASSVSVRRAVAVPAPDEGPGAQLGPRTPDSAAPVPIPSSPEPAPRRLRGWRARSAAEQQEPVSAEQQQAQEPQQAGQQQESASAEPEREESLGVFLAGNDGGANGADGADPAETPPGRPRGPMLAAAGITGALLIAVPFLILGLSDDDEGTVSTAPIGGTTLDAGTSGDDPAADYVAESPAPSASPTGSPSPSKSKSVSSGSGVAGVEVRATPQPVVTKETAAPKAKVTKAASLTPRQMANALSNRANVLLKNIATNRCADLPGSGKGKSGGSVNQHLSCSSTDNQLWDLKVTYPDSGPGGSSLFVIKNRTDGLCMDLPYYTNVKPETQTTEHACDGSNSDNQLYWLDPRPEGYWIRNAASNMCIGVNGGSSATDNAYLKVVKCGDTSVSAQRWIVSQVVKP
ncbi:RICIN domain-containing protein [Streptomyces fulvoviolaceus]|uniref:RICIN domain-containing protein n=1 Tax=Streptomyces fulvoviolaceus TaxID=285535 RepID=UPI000693EBA1|nr:RICIN domain-containing protein [Streptomyces fulvoviolaceus]